MYVCLSVCIYVCMSVCLSVYIYVCMYVCLSVCLYLCVYVCLSVCLSVSMCVCMSIWHMLLYLYADDSVVGRTDHTSVLWKDWIWVYGGYMFTDDEEVTESGSGQNEIFVDFIRYHLTNGHWEEVIISSITRPQPRYAHTAVVYNVSSELLHHLFYLTSFTPSPFSHPPFPPHPPLPPHSPILHSLLILPSSTPSPFSHPPLPPHSPILHSLLILPSSTPSLFSHPPLPPYSPILHSLLLP